MKVVGIIPCSYQSSRFPGKPSALIDDKSIMCYIYQRAFKLSGLKIFKDNPPTSLERIEGIEMYHLLERQHRIAMVQTNDSSLSVAMPSDFKRVQKISYNE